MSKVRFLIRYDAVAREYVAEAASPEGCCGRGATPGEALRLAREAVIAWLETAIALGVPA